MSESYRENLSSRKIIKQFISKLKIVKQTKQINVMNDAEIPTESLEIIELNEPKSITETETENDDCHQEILSNDFKSFCKEIEKFFNYIKDNENLSYYIHKYPNIVSKQINIDVEELQNLLAELKETATNIKKLKTQQKLIKKEIFKIKKSVRRIKDSETRELESTVSRYDKDMYIQWTKSKWKCDDLEDLLCDVQEKQLALQCLNKLINQSLERTENNLSLDQESEKNSINNEKSISLLSSVSSIQSKIPLPPANFPVPLPRPVSLTVNTLNRNNSRLSWIQRRLKAERRGNFAEVKPIAENHENEPYVFSFNMNNNTGETNVYSNFNPFESDISSRFSSDSNGTISSQASRNQNQYSSSNISRDNNDIELKLDVQSILTIDN